MEPLGKKAKTIKRTVFKTAFDSPLLQWPKIDHELVGKEILARSIAELAKYASLLARPSKDSRRKRPRLSESNKLPESPLMVGINQVTRALENNCLGAVLACKDDLTFGQILHHIPFQCRLVGCPVVPLPKGSASELASLFNLPRVTLLGIKKDCPELDQFLQYLRSKVPTPEHDLAHYQALCIQRIPVVSNSSRKASKKGKT